MKSITEIRAVLERENEDVVCGVITEAGTDRAAYRIVGCSWCGKAFDSVTRQYTKKPERILSHGICDNCSAGILAGRADDMEERMRRREDGCNSCERKDDG